MGIEQTHINSTLFWTIQYMKTSSTTANNQILGKN